MPYPNAIDDIKSVSPELILLWARRTILYLETEHFEVEIKKIEEKKAENADSVTKEEESSLIQFKELLVAAEEEKKIVMEKHDEIEQKLAVSNEFADAVKDHKEVAHNHAHRLEQATKEIHDEL